MPSFEQSLSMQAPPDQVLAFVSDIRNLPRYVPTTKEPSPRARAASMWRATPRPPLRRRRLPAADGRRPRMGRGRGLLQGLAARVARRPGSHVTVGHRAQGPPARRRPREAPSEDDIIRRGSARGLESIRNPGRGQRRRRNPRPRPEATGGGEGGGPCRPHRPLTPVLHRGPAGTGRSTTPRGARIAGRGRRACAAPRAPRPAARASRSGRAPGRCPGPAGRPRRSLPPKSKGGRRAQHLLRRHLEDRERLLAQGRAASVRPGGRRPRAPPRPAARSRARARAQQHPGRGRASDGGTARVAPKSRRTSPARRPVPAEVGEVGVGLHSCPSRTSRATVRARRGDPTPRSRSP
jgi:hypothetical protein